MSLGVLDDTSDAPFWVGLVIDEKETKTTVWWHGVDLTTGNRSHFVIFWVSQSDCLEDLLTKSLT